MHWKGGKQSIYIYIYIYIPWHVWLPDRGSLDIDALAHRWPWVLHKFALPPVILLAQTLCMVSEDEEHVLPVVLLADPELGFRTYVPSITAPPGASLWGRTSFLKGLAPCGTRVQILEPPFVVHGWDMADFSVFVHWWWKTHSDQSPLHEATSCLGVESVRDLVFFSLRRPQRCMIGVVLFSLQERLDHRLSPYTLKVNVAAITAHHVAVDGLSLGKHDIIVSFLRGARRLNPPRPPLVASWDLSIVRLDSHRQRRRFVQVASVGEAEYRGSASAADRGLVSSH